MKMEILKKVRAKELSAGEAFARLYGRPPKKARFLVLRIFLKKEKFISFIVNLIFLLPFPLFIVKPFLSPALKKAGIAPEQFQELLACGGGTKISVHSREAKVFVKLI